jgi:hypothetical protein
MPLLASAQVGGRRQHVVGGADDARVHFVGALGGDQIGDLGDRVDIGLFQEGLEQGAVAFRAGRCDLFGSARRGLEEQIVANRLQARRVDEAGDLIDVTNVSITHTNNAKQVHTLRRDGAGVVLGVKETTVSFDAVISEDGPERDYFQLVKLGRIQQLRIKIPGQTITVQGVYKDSNFELPLDDAIKVSLAFIGKSDAT